MGHGAASWGEAGGTGLVQPGEGEQTSRGFQVPEEMEQALCRGGNENQWAEVEIRSPGWV